jgi:hypothetical protein
LNRDAKVRVFRARIVVVYENGEFTLRNERNHV